MKRIVIENGYNGKPYTYRYRTAIGELGNMTEYEFYLPYKLSCEQAREYAKSKAEGN